MHFSLSQIAQHDGRKRMAIIALVVGIVSALTGCGGGGGGGGGGNVGGGNVGGTPSISVLATVPNPSSLVVIDNTLFFSDGSEAPVKKLSLTTGSGTPLAGKIGTIIGLTIRESSLFWVDHRDQTYERILYRTSLDGSGTTILQIGESGSTNYVSNIVADEGNVYWVTTTRAPYVYPLIKVPIDGSPPVTITSSTIPITALAVDSAYVYWEEWTGSVPGNNGVLRRAPIAGGASEVLASGFLRFTGGMVLSGSNLFFSDTTDGNNPVCRIM